MAEARAIASLDDSKKSPVHLSVSNEGLTLSFTIPTWRRFVQNTSVRVKAARRWLGYSLFPLAPLVSVLLVSIGIVWIATSKEGDWIRSGWLAQLVWRVSEWFPWLRLPLMARLVILAGWTSLVIAILLATFQRFLIRCMLRYKGFVYHSRKPTIVLKLWFIVMRILYGIRARAGMYAFQNVLPALPVPPLEETCRKYLASVKPTLSEEEFVRVQDLTKEFLATQGPKFQRYLWLKSLWADNYVTDWWEKYVYLHGRDSIMINSNYYCLDAARGHPVAIQEARLALIIYHMVDYNVDLNEERLKPTCMGGGVVPLCMDQFRRLFATCRLPGREADRIRHWDVTEQSPHVAVLCNGSIYKLYVNRTNGGRVACHELESQLAEIKADALSREPDEAESHIPALTAENRTRWAEVRETHFSEGLNRRSLHTIESALFFVHMDVETEAIDTWTDRGRALIHGNGAQRWFDKSFSLVVFKNGRAGLNAEHSFADAPVVAHLFELSMIIAEKVHNWYDDDGHIVPQPVKQGCSREAIVPWSRLEWSLTRPCEALIETAFTNARALIADLDLIVVSYDSYGKGFMKKCRVSPDAYIQMAMQLAYYKDAGRFNATYEASMTRLFKHGRTETVRPVSEASANFVFTMLNDKASSEDKLKALQAAAARHQIAYQDAMCGKGIDRHLFALYIVSKGLDVESPFLKTAVGEPWRLSTSQQPQNQTGLWNPSGEDAHRVSPGGGFGPVADDGYGISYMVASETEVFFHISSKKSSSSTDSSRFRDHLFESFDQMKAVLESATVSAGAGAGKRSGSKKK